MSDQEILQAILAKVTGIEGGQGNLSDRFGKVEERLAKIERKVDGQQAWFHTLAEKFEELEQKFVQLACEMGEMRDLMTVMHEDDVVNKRAIASVSYDLETLRQRITAAAIP